MCLCVRRSSQSCNCQSVKCSVETIFIPVENIQSPHSVTTYPLWDHFPKPLTNNVYFNDRTTCHNRCVSCLQSSNSFLKTEYEGASLFALSTEVGNNYKISLHFDLDCVFYELRLVCKYKFKNENRRPSELSRRTIASINSV